LITSSSLSTTLSGKPCPYETTQYAPFSSERTPITAESRKEKIAALEEIVNSRLLKGGVLTLERIKGSQVLLLKLVAFQAGCLISVNEPATQVRLDVKTVSPYLDIFENAFVVVRIGGFSRNLRLNALPQSSSEAILRP
jgi:hypothetical protein